MNVYTHVGWVMRSIAVMNVYIHVCLGHARNRCDECLHMNDRESMNIYVCIYEQLRSAAASDRESHGEHSYTTIHPACMRGEWWAGVSLLGGRACSRRGWGRSPNRPVIKLENKASHDESRAGYDIAAVERA